MFNAREGTGSCRAWRRRRAARARHPVRSPTSARASCPVSRGAVTSRHAAQGAAAIAHRAARDTYAVLDVRIGLGVEQRLDLLRRLLMSEHSILALHQSEQHIGQRREAARARAYASSSSTSLMSQWAAANGIDSGAILAYGFASPI